MADFAETPPSTSSKSVANFFVDAIVTTKNGLVELFDALAEVGSGPSQVVLGYHTAKPQSQVLFRWPASQFKELFDKNTATSMKLLASLR